MFNIINRITGSCDETGNDQTYTGSKNLNNRKMKYEKLICGVQRYSCIPRVPTPTIKGSDLESVKTKPRTRSKFGTKTKGWKQTRMKSKWKNQMSKQNYQRKLNIQKVRQLKIKKRCRQPIRIEYTWANQKADSNGRISKSQLIQQARKWI